QKYRSQQKMGEPFPRKRRNTTERRERDRGQNQPRSGCMEIEALKFGDTIEQFLVEQVREHMLVQSPAVRIDEASRQRCRERSEIPPRMRHFGLKIERPDAWAKHMRNSVNQR